MTAQVIVMNKNGLAVATDSAVTVTNGNGRKAFNNADKLFSLSKHHPVGVMIYNSSYFLDTPWELIIKEYRLTLGEDCFKTLEEYFLDFLKFTKEKFINDENWAEFLLQKIYSKFWQLIEQLIDETNKVVQSILKTSDVFTGEYVSEFDIILEKYYQGIVLEGFENLTLEEKNAFKDQNYFNFDYTEMVDVYTDLKSKLYDIISDLHEEITDGFNRSISENSSTEDNSKRINMICSILVIDYLENFGDSYSGIVFMGYGSEDLYPSFIERKIAGALENRVKVKFEDSKSQQISSKRNSHIEGFAQDDVIQSFTNGISYEALQTIKETLFNGLSEYTMNYFKREINEEAVTALDEVKTEIKLDDASLDELSDDLVLQIAHTFYPQRRQILSTVSTFSKSQLAELANTLVESTSFKQKVSMTLESVGGPVDVAVISKHEGFIWIDRKLYFEANLNQDYLNRNGR